jgi:nitroreductase
VPDHQHANHQAADDVWEVMSTARSIRRFTDEPVDAQTLNRCLQAATWAPNGANAQLWRFVVLDAPEQRAAVAEAARIALQTIESVYGMTRPDPADTSRQARNNRAIYELHERAGERTSVLFTAYKTEFASEYLQGGSIYPAMQNFFLAARALGLGACFTSWASYGGEQILRAAVGVPDSWFIAGHVVVGWPRGRHGPLRRRPVGDVVFYNRWDPDRADIVHGRGARPQRG